MAKKISKQETTPVQLPPLGKYFKLMGKPISWKDMSLLGKKNISKAISDCRKQLAYLKRMKSLGLHYAGALRALDAGRGDRLPKFLQTITELQLVIKELVQMRKTAIALPLLPCFCPVLKIGDIYLLEEESGVEELHILVGLTKKEEEIIAIFGSITYSGDSETDLWNTEIYPDQEGSGNFCFPVSMSDLKLLEQAPPAFMRLWDKFSSIKRETVEFPSEITLRQARIRALQELRYMVHDPAQKESIRRILQGDRKYVGSRKKRQSQKPKTTQA